MDIFGVTTVILISSQLILQTCSFDYNPVPDLVKVRRREDAGDAEFVVLDFIGLVEEQGRRAEEHNVTTEDGYKLKLFRVPPNPNTVTKSGQNPVVYLGHGLAATSDCFVMFGPGKSLAYILSDAGYDVWIGNLRGNSYGREHETLSPDRADFWNFSLDEFGVVDLPSMIDYTMNYTGQKKISYIGHSVGTTTMLMLLAEKPEYNEKLDVVIHFAPVAYPTSKSLVRLLAANALLIIQKLLDPWGTTELGKQSSSVTAFATRICLANNILELCYLPIAIMGGGDREQLPIKELLSYLNYYPAGTSTKSLYHYAQMFRTSKFRKYDYENVAMNMKHYGQPEPPDYDLSHVDVPTVMFHGRSDPLSTAADTEALISHFHPNASILLQVVPFKAFSHGDFVIAKDVKTLVYDRVMQILAFFH